MADKSFPLTAELTRIYNVWSSSTFRRSLIDSTGLDLGETESRCLWWLGGCDDVRITDLARQLDLGIPSVSKAVSKLRQRGLVDSRGDVKDGRVALLNLTPKGRRAAIQLMGAGDVMVRTIVADWSDIEVERFRTLSSRFAVAAEEYILTMSPRQAPPA